MSGLFASRGGEGGASLNIGGGGRGLSFKIEMFDGSGVILEAGYLMLIPETTTINQLAAVSKSNTFSHHVIETIGCNVKVLDFEQKQASFECTCRMQSKRQRRGLLCYTVQEQLKEGFSQRRAHKVCQSIDLKNVERSVKPT